MQAYFGAIFVQYISEKFSKTLVALKLHVDNFQHILGVE